MKWRGTSLELEKNEENNSFIELLKSENIDVKISDGIYKVENQKDYFILEDDFIEKSKRFPTIIRKLSDKNYDKPIKVYDRANKKFNYHDLNYNDKSIYKKVTESNNIDGEIRNFHISISRLNETLDNSKPKSQLLIDFLILLALATKVTYTAEKFKVEFITDEDKFVDEFNLNSKPLYLFPLYEWVIVSKEYKDSYKIKLQIMRKIIVNKRSINEVNEILKDCILAHRRIISYKTDDYFSQVNDLKKDFLKLADDENSTLRALNISIFAWLGSLGMQLFNIVKDYDRDNFFWYLITSKGEKKIITILVFLISLLFIFICYLGEMNALKEKYNTIKKIYKDNILFELGENNVKKFEDFIIEPQYGKAQLIFLIIIFIALLVRLFVALPINI